MTDYLVYWRSFREDVDPEHLEQVSHDWRTKNGKFYREVQNGDNLWVVISAGKDSPQQWRLLQRIYVECPDLKLHPSSKYGKYRVIGDDKQSQVFELEFQDDLAPTLRKLRFASGRNIKLKGRQIGQALQMIRRLSDSDIQLLEKYCKTLKPLA